VVILRKLYKDRKNLVENYDMIDAFVDDAMSVVSLGTDLGAVKDSHTIFEVVMKNSNRFIHNKIT
jgi:hypothetical protein